MWKIGSRHLEILKDFKSGDKQSMIARKHGVSRQWVSKVVNNYTTLLERGIDGKSLHSRLLKQICESCRDKKAIHLHHIDGNCENDDEGNLISLCHFCHIYLHKKILSRNRPFRCKDCGIVFTTLNKHCANGLCERCNNRERARIFRIRHSLT